MHWVAFIFFFISLYQLKPLHDPHGPATLIWAVQVLECNFWAALTLILWAIHLK